MPFRPRQKVTAGTARLSNSLVLYGSQTPHMRFHHRPRKKPFFCISARCPRLRRRVPLEGCTRHLACHCHGNVLTVRALQPRLSSAVRSAAREDPLPSAPPASSPANPVAPPPPAPPSSPPSSPPLVKLLSLPLLPLLLFPCLPTLLLLILLLFPPLPLLPLPVLRLRRVGASAHGGS